MAFWRTQSLFDGYSRRETRSRPLKAGISPFGENDENPQGVFERNLREVASRRVNDRDVLREQRPLESRVGASLARHERMFAYRRASDDEAATR